MSCRLRSVIPVFALMLLFASAAVPAAKRNLYPLSQVKAGQIAVAKSVFRGTKVETFHVKIIGVIPKYDGARSLILGKVLDGPVVAQKSGVVAGMSGSPVYLDGKLVGAISMTWSFSKEPIAGITPIGDMLEAWQEPTASPKEQVASELPAPLRVNGALINQVQVAPQPPSQPEAPGVMTLVPLGGTIQVAGFSPRVVAHMQSEFEPFGVRVAAGGGGAMESLRPALVPGAAIGARLVGGDFDMTALGTVTMVEGGRILAFGHPFMQLGTVDLPMTGGYVHGILSSLYLSNKVMSPTQVVGRVTRDHQSAIAGAMGGRADMLPITIEVTDSDLGRTKTYQVEVARLRELMPTLAASCVMTAVDELRGRVARGTAEVSVTLQAGTRTITRNDVSYSASDAAAGAVAPVVTPLSAFTESPFGKLRVDRIKVKVRTFEQRRTAAIERLTINQSRLKAGDTVTVTATLRPFGEQPVEVPISLSLPEDLPKGRVRLVVTGGGDAEQARGALGAPRPAPVSLAQLVQRFEAEPQKTELILQAALPQPTATIEGEELPGIPRTALEELSATRPTDLRPVPSIIKLSQPTEWVLAGRQTLTVQVDSEISAPTPAKPSGEEEPEEDTEEKPTFSLSLPEPDYVATRWGGGPSADGLGAPAGAAAPTPDATEQKPTAMTKAPEAWTQSSPASYNDWKLSNVMLAWDGSLSLSAAMELTAALTADVIWSLAVKEGVIYAGTGRKGVIYRITSDGKVTSFFDTGEMNVHALAFAPDGNLYAGTSPGGKVFRISPDGKGEAVLDSDSSYIWALAASPDGTVYASAGAPARVYTLKPNTPATTLAELPVANIVSLVLAASGEMYAGTADAGLIYRVTPEGAATVIGQVPGASVDGLALASDGTLWATSSPGGQVYRVPVGGKPELYLESGQSSAYDLALLPDGQPAVATGPNGLFIGARAQLRPVLLLRPSADGLGTALVQESGALYLATSAPAVVHKLSAARAVSGTAESGVLDAERTAHWGKVTVSAETPEGTAVQVETRSGDAPTPETSWSNWEPTVSGAIASPPARYLQYRLTLTSTKPEASPVVRQVIVSRRAQNRAPNISLRGPEPGQRLAKQQSLKWQAQDPDKDALTFRVDLSADLGATWTELAKNLKEPKYDWDTTKQKDGQYLLRVSASDALSAPGDPLSSDSAAAIWVDNAPPLVMLIKSAVVVDDQQRATISPLVTEALSPIQSIEYRVDEGDWQSVPIGSVETMLASPMLRTDALKPGKHRLVVRAFDAAGNVASDAVEVEVKTPPVEEKPAPAAPVAATAAPATPEPAATPASEATEAASGTVPK